MDERIIEMKALIERWRHATDPESLWILGLLREAIEKLEAEQMPSPEGRVGQL